MFLEHFQHEGKVKMVSKFVINSGDEAFPPFFRRVITLVWSFFLASSMEE